ncbi:hypothetical protein ACFQHW_05985 [Lapidilactobacillus achengensis]|uniref:Alpha-galactosidase n=1 Tax=Lapidilactobacillus achengensis TaxID=2486000 RepID=A0ABW1UQ73_9LACO
MPFRKAQSDAHSELTPNFAAQAAANPLLSTKCTTTTTAKRQPNPR